MKVCNFSFVRKSYLCSPGGAADVCELKLGDEIVSINSAKLANHYLESVRTVIDQAVHTGLVELAIRRPVGEEGGRF